VDGAVGNLSNMADREQAQDQLELMATGAAAWTGRGGGRYALRNPVDG